MIHISSLNEESKFFPSSLSEPNPNTWLVLFQVPRPRVQIRPPCPAGRGGPQPARHRGGGPLGGPGGAGHPPPGADGGRPEEAAEGSAAAALQWHPPLPHRQRDELRVRTRGAEVRLPGASLLQHPRWRRDPGGAQREKPLQVL